MNCYICTFKHHYNSFIYGYRQARLCLPSLYVILFLSLTNKNTLTHRGTKALRERQINAWRERCETVLLKTLRLICACQTRCAMHHLTLMILRVLGGYLLYELSESNFRTSLREILSAVNQCSIVLTLVDKGHKQQ